MDQKGTNCFESFDKNLLTHRAIYTRLLRELDNLNDVERRLFKAERSKPTAFVVYVLLNGCAIFELINKYR